jgi:hypothetical protein
MVRSEMFSIKINNCSSIVAVGVMIFDQHTVMLDGCEAF